MIGLMKLLSGSPHRVLGVDLGHEPLAILRHGDASSRCAMLQGAPHALRAHESAVTGMLPLHPVLGVVTPAARADPDGSTVHVGARNACPRRYGDSFTSPVISANVVLDPCTIINRILHQADGHRWMLVR